jgi:hypothetical protein
LLDKLTKAAGVRAVIPEVKGMWRVLEKLALRDGLPGNGIPWDIVRAQIVGDSMSDLLAALELLLGYPGVRVVQVNDRFANPKSGWADCAVYLCFPNNSFPDIMAEVQCCHSKMLHVREEWGAHDSYSDARFFAELVMNKYRGALQTFATLPWSRFEEWLARGKARALENEEDEDESDRRLDDKRMSKSMTT